MHYEFVSGSKLTQECLNKYGHEELQDWIASGGDHHDEDEDEDEERALRRA